MRPSMPLRVPEALLAPGGSPGDYWEGYSEKGGTRMSLGTNHHKKAIQLRLPVTLLAKVDAMAVTFELSREATIRLMLAGADETTLIRGFARLTEEENSR